MRKYEVTYVIAPTLGDEQVPEVIERFSQQIQSQGGRVVNVSPWGKRRLAYEIGGHGEGYYVTMQFESTSEAADELARVMKLSDAVIRSLLVHCN